MPNFHVNQHLDYAQAPKVKIISLSKINNVLWYATLERCELRFVIACVTAKVPPSNKVHTQKLNVKHIHTLPIDDANVRTSCACITMHYTIWTRGTRSAKIPHHWHFISAADPTTQTAIPSRLQIAYTRWTLPKNSWTKPETNQLSTGVLLCP